MAEDKERFTIVVGSCDAVVNEQQKSTRRNNERERDLKQERKWDEQQKANKQNEIEI